jgi:cytidylate kinase
MSGGAAFARCLGTSLGYPVLAREVLVEAAARLGVPEDVLRKNIQSCESFESLREERSLFLYGLQSALADHCLSGDLVYHGHAGQFLLKGLPTLLRVRLIAPRSVRIRTLVERQALDPAAAREYIRNVDQERVEWTKFVYGADWRDPKNYDLVINLQNVSMDTACEMVSHVVKLPAYQTTPAVLEGLRNFALACRVQLALANEPALRGIRFEVRADAGKVEVDWHRAPGAWKAGPSGFPEELIQRTAMTVEGVRELTLRLRESGRHGKVA